MALSYAKRLGEIRIDWRTLGVQPEDGDDFRFIGGQRLIVEPFAGLRLEATGISVREGAEGAQTWMGRIERPRSGQVTITRHRDAVFGNVDYGLDRYVFQSGRDGRVFVREADQRGLGRCAFDARAEGLPRFDQGLLDRGAKGTSTTIKAEAATTSELTKGLEATTEQGGRKPATPAPGVAKSNGHATVDILVLYTPDVAAGAGGNPQAMIQNFVDHANMSFMDGQIQGSLNLVGSSLITGVNQALGPQQSWEDRVQEVRTGSGPFEGVPALRNALGADLVALLVVAGPEWLGGQWVAPQACGMANLSGRVSGIDNPVLGSEWGAFSVTDAWCSAADLTFTHEIGHNLGGMHGGSFDLAVLGNTNTPDHEVLAATRHSVGHNRDQTWQPFRTLMASSTVNGSACSMQGCPRLNRWSSPTQSYFIGNWIPVPLGGPTGLCLSPNAEDLLPCDPANSPQFTDMTGSHQYAMPLIAQYRGAPFPPLPLVIADWDLGSCTLPRNTVRYWWQPNPDGPAATYFELQLSSVPWFDWWATTLVYAGPATSHAQMIGAVTYARVRACGPGGCSAWGSIASVPFPIPTC